MITVLITKDLSRQIFSVIACYSKHWVKLGDRKQANEIVYLSSDHQVEISGTVTDYHQRL